MPKLCIECKHHYGTVDHYCQHPQLTKTDLVTGEKTYTNCYEARRALGSDTKCGPFGKLWKTKKWKLK